VNIVMAGLVLAAAVVDWRLDWSRVFMVLAGWVRTWAMERDTAPQIMFSQKRRPRVGVVIATAAVAPPRIGDVGDVSGLVVATMDACGLWMTVFISRTLDDPSDPFPFAFLLLLLRGKKALPTPIPISILVLFDEEAELLEVVVVPLNNRCDKGDGNLVFTDRSPTEMALRLFDDE